VLFANTFCILFTTKHSQHQHYFILLKLIFLRFNQHSFNLQKLYTQVGPIYRMSIGREKKTSWPEPFLGSLSPSLPSTRARAVAVSAGRHVEARHLPPPPLPPLRPCPPIPGGLRRRRAWPLPDAGAPLLLPSWYRPFPCLKSFRR